LSTFIILINVTGNAEKALICDSYFFQVEASSTSFTSLSNNNNNNNNNKTTTYIAS